MLITNRRPEVLYYTTRPDGKAAWGNAECLPPGWLPTDLTPPAIRWIRAGSQSPTDPFFDIWVTALRSRVPPPLEHETDLSSLAQSVAHLPEVEPAGIIFHVSRCGSTLLANALSAGENVFAIGEAQAIDKAAQLPASRDPRARGADAAVPCVMLTRAPLEVVFSNLQSPPKPLLDWYDAPSTCFAAVPEEALAHGIGEFCAWLVGRICSEALEQLDDKCMLLDYRDLTPYAALRVAEFFSVRMSDERRHALHRAFLFDAKRGGEFNPDADRKKKAAAACLAEFVARWALGPYEDLLRSPWRLRGA